jgi:thioredoxin-like negative regulator of GroEL
MPAWGWVALAVGVVGLMAVARSLSPGDRRELRARAEAAAQAGDWGTSLELWRRINASPEATGTTQLGEGRACLTLGRAAQAERALRKAAAASPGEPAAWLLLLEIFWVEDRPLDAFDLGWEALEYLAPEDRPALLRKLTLAALTDLPDDLARDTLRRWIDADPEDVDARVALLRRVGAEPRSGDPDRQARIAELTGLLDRHPGHVGVREVLVTALADAGEPERGREYLDGWPADARDGRYWRLRGRWDLEYDHRADPAVTAFRAALESFPQDWRTHYRLARALQILNRPDEARQEAEAVGRIRELLDPLTLGPKLDAAFAHLGEPAAAGTLAELCGRVGLTRLADAWRASRDSTRAARSGSESRSPVDAVKVASMQRSGRERNALPARPSGPGHSGAAFPVEW